MKATIYYKDIDNDFTVPCLNVRVINFTTTSGLKQSFRKAIAKDYGNLLRVYGTAKIIHACAIMNESNCACATTKILL